MENTQIKSTYSESKRICFQLVLLIFFSLALKVILFFCDPTISRDGIGYIRVVQYWFDYDSFASVTEHFPDFSIPPFFLYLMKSLMYAGGAPETAGILLNIAAGTFLPPIIYGIAAEITQNRRIALIAALLMACHPVIAELSVQIQRDAVGLFFTGLVILFLCMWIRREKWYFAGIAGLFLACALLTRYEVIEIFPIILIICFILLIKKKFSLRQLSIHFWGFLCLFFMTFSCLNLLMGTWQFTTQYYMRYVGWKKYMLEQQINEMMWKDDMQQ